MGVCGCVWGCTCVSVLLRHTRVATDVPTLHCIEVNRHTHTRTQALTAEQASVIESAHAGLLEVVMGDFKSSALPARAAVLLRSLNLAPELLGE